MDDLWRAAGWQVLINVQIDKMDSEPRLEYGFIIVPGFHKPMTVYHGCPLGVQICDKLIPN